MVAGRFPLLDVALDLGSGQRVWSTHRSTRPPENMCKYAYLPKWQTANHPDELSIYFVGI